VNGWVKFGVLSMLGNCPHAYLNGGLLLNPSGIRKSLHVLTQGVGIRLDPVLSCMDPAGPKTQSRVLTPVDVVGGDLHVGFRFFCKRSAKVVVNLCQHQYPHLEVWEG